MPADTRPPGGKTAAARRPRLAVRALRLISTATLANGSPAAEPSLGLQHFLHVGELDMPHLDGFAVELSKRFLECRLSDLVLHFRLGHFAQIGIGLA